MSVKDGQSCNTKLIQKVRRMTQKTSQELTVGPCRSVAVLGPALVQCASVPTWNTQTALKNYLGICMFCFYVCVMCMCVVILGCLVIKFKVLAHRSSSRMD